MFWALEGWAPSYMDWFDSFFFLTDLGPVSLFLSIFLFILFNGMKYFI